MSRFMIASEENLYALKHYGVKGMKWGRKNKMFGKGFEKGAKKSEDIWGHREVENIETEKIDVKPIKTEKIDVKPIKTEKIEVKPIKIENSKVETISRENGPTYLTLDRETGKTIIFNSKKEKDEYDKKRKKQDRQQKIDKAKSKVTGFVDKVKGNFSK